MRDFRDGDFWTAPLEHPYQCTTVGASNPLALGGSLLVLEREVREAWWRVGPGDVVLDVGAGFGSYALPALAAGAGLVVCWEPHRDDFFDLHTQVLLNRFGDRAVLLNVLAGEWSGVERYCPGRRRAAVGEEERLVVPVDHAAADLDRLDWLKVDVEGAELEVLRGAWAALGRFSPTVIVECHEGFVPGVAEGVAGFMRGLGYRDAGRITAPREANGVWHRWRKP